MSFASARFITSAATLAQLPEEGPPEIAFAGRSNVGKSSAINAILGRRKLAFTSKTPGRTQTINFFDIPGRGRVADLPGYGFARVPQPVRAQWDRLVGGYLATRASLRALIVIMDARRPYTEHDLHMLAWARPLASDLLVILSKSDKLTRQHRTRTAGQARARLLSEFGRGELIVTSTLSGEGVEEARKRLDAWLAPGAEIKGPR